MPCRTVSPKILHKNSPSDDNRLHEFSAQVPRRWRKMHGMKNAKNNSDKNNTGLKTNGKRAHKLQNEAKKIREKRKQRKEAEKMIAYS